MNPLHPVDLPGGVGREHVGHPAAFHGEVVSLAADQGVGAGRPGEHETTAGGDRRLQAGGQRLEGQRLEGVAAEDRRRLVERPVAGGDAPAQVVVVHRRQVVVDERIGMDHLHRRGGGGGGVPIAAAGLRPPEHECRPEPLARGEQGVPQGRVEPVRGFRRPGDAPLEQGIDEGLHPVDRRPHVGQRGCDVARQCRVADTGIA